MHRLSLIVFAVACQEPCPEGWVLREGYCFVSEVPSPDTGDEPAGFGSPCDDGTTCTAPADYCLVQPGQTAGYCTAPDCDVDPDACPTSWTCLDLGQFDPELPAVCQRP